MSEARRRIDAAAGAELSARAMTGLTHDERGRLARLIYDEARRYWAKMANHDAPPLRNPEGQT